MTFIRVVYLWIIGKSSLPTKPHSSLSNIRTSKTLKWAPRNSQFIKYLLSTNTLWKVFPGCYEDKNVWLGLNFKSGGVQSKHNVQSEQTSVLQISCHPVKTGLSALLLSEFLWKIGILHQSVTFVKMLIRMNVRIYSYQQNYTNEYLNIFILFFWHERMSE